MKKVFMKRVGDKSMARVGVTTAPFLCHAMLLQFMIVRDHQV
jgi:hypothetical protein